MGDTSTEDDASRDSDSHSSDGESAPRTHRTLPKVRKHRSRTRKGQQSIPFPVPKSKQEKIALYDQRAKEIKQLRATVESLRTKLGDPALPIPERAQKRYWSMREHERFLTWLVEHKATKVASLDVWSLSEFVGTRSPVQCRTHAQKFFDAVHSGVVMDPKDE
ncbi:hypothetical protein Pelo_11924 [Pelomyxa schiedti]|nr:hypothetical protein Pelo_11924 [Pelomyxa schiedti]